jgi:hypothetical protein
MEVAPFVGQLVLFSISFNFTKLNEQNHNSSTGLLDYLVGGEIKRGCNGKAEPQRRVYRTTTLGKFTSKTKKPRYYGRR